MIPKTANDDACVHHPKRAAEADIFKKAFLAAAKSLMKEVEIKETVVGETKVQSYAFDEAKEIDDSTVEELSKTMFNLTGAFPYIFDALCGMLTNREKLSQKYKKDILNFADIPESIFFMIDIPFEEFLEWALDGKTEQKDRLIENLNNMANASPKELQKYIPISQNYCARVAPIQIVLIRKKENTIPANILTSLHNLTLRKTNIGSQGEKTISLLPEKLPIERIQIHHLKLLFQDLIKGSSGINWLEVPKSFQSKIVDFRPKYIEKLSIKLAKLLKGLDKTQSYEEKEEKKKSVKN
jgi:hypothetical protein